MLTYTQISKFKYNYVVYDGCININEKRTCLRQVLQVLWMFYTISSVLSACR